MGSGRQRWSWYVSAPFYRRTYIGIAHQLDEELFAYLGGRTRGAVVADCGCGPGVVAEKFLRHGAAHVFAVDMNAAMLRQARARLADSIAAGRVEAVQRVVDATFFVGLRGERLDGGGLDIILFKRSLYARREQALPTLRAAVSCLNPRGVLAVIHGERSLRRHAFGPGWRPTRYTAYHLFNRFISRLGEKLGIGDYTLYTQRELLALLQAAAGDRRVELIPSRQRAYNLAAILG
jgi:SAM-dependent methyltransferase